MARRKPKFSETYINNIQRFNKQLDKLGRLQTLYNTHNKSYYGKSKRQNLLSNQYEIYKNVNPFDLKPGELNRVLRENAQAIRRLGYNKMTGDLAEAAVLTELNNESYNSIDFADSEGDYDRDFASLEQDRIFGEILANSLRELRLSKRQLDIVLNRSVLPEHIKADVRDDLLNYWKKLRK